MNFPKRASPVHKASLTVGTDTIIISRTKSPELEISYNTKTKEYAVIESNELPGPKQDQLVNKAIAWAKHNIINK